VITSSSTKDGQLQGVTLPQGAGMRETATRHRAAHGVETRLQQRRPAAVRRHAGRPLARLATLLGADVAAIAALTWASSLIVASGLLDALLPATIARLLEEAYRGSEHFPAALLLSLVLTGNYDRRSDGRQKTSLLQGSALTVTLAFWSPLVSYGFGSVVMPYFVAVAVTWLALIGGRELGRRFRLSIWPGARGVAPAVLIGTEADYRTAVDFETRSAGSDYRLLGYVLPEDSAGDGPIGPLEDLAEIIDRHGIETVIVGRYLPDHQLATVLDVSLIAGCELLYPARAVKLAGVRPKLVWRHGQPFYELGAPVLKAQQLLIKRLVDLVGAGLGLVGLFPVFLAIALAVRLDSPGPIFFSQNRAGLGGRRFRMLKFRTMRAGADGEKGAFAHLNHTGDRRLFKILEDPRVTRLGAWLRRWSLDELPQLWNVLQGDMSLVGPRPFFESDLEDYEAHHFRRLGAKPGITGLWQVSGRSAVVDFEEVVRLDRQYIERWSFGLDLRVLLRTFPAVLRRTGAY
jgi:exopolysaccharide biosynthesis polyprenyl glycosylphosphotransferase